MYGIDPADNFSFMHGARLIQVCFGENEFILNFDTNLRVTVLSEYSLRRAPGDDAASFSTPVAGASLLLGLLGKTVEAVEVSSRVCLRVHFAHGPVLELLDSSSAFESFWIQNGERRVVV